MRLRFSVLPGEYALCKLPPNAPIPPWALTGLFTTATRTADELSIVCPAENVPAEVVAELRWNCLKIKGPLSLSDVGILAGFINPLATAKVPIFTISTYNTDYVLVPTKSWDAAASALRDAGHELAPE